MSESFLQLAERRRSVRRYDPRPVEPEKIRRCLEAARRAPSACNAQPWTFIVVDDPALKRRVAAAAGGGALPLNHFVHQAPALVVIVMERPNVSSRLGAAIKGKPFSFMDVGIAAEHFCLQATEEGLGTCMLGWFDEDRVRRLLGVPESARPALMLTVGYPADGDPPARARKSLDAMSAWNAYPDATPSPRAVGSFPGLAGWLILTYAAAALGAVATASAGEFYAALERPPWAPPGALFGPVWSVLYTLMALSAWQVWRARGWRGARGALSLYLSQLALNALWSWLFFRWRLGAGAFLEILALIAAAGATAIAFARIRRAAAAFLLPYLAWLAYAAALAFAVWRRNPVLQ